jgi:predicted acylesterase/phospholipase RssA
VPPADEGTLRYAFALARVVLEVEAGSPTGFEEFERAVSSASIALFGHSPATDPIQPEPELISAAARRLWGLTLAARGQAAALAGQRLEALDDLVRHRRLALALGGGGGSGYVYLGCFQLLEEWGLRPSLIAGTSMGAVLGLLRAREERFDLAQLLEILQHLSYRRLFRFFRTKSHYAIPGAFRLYLRKALQRWVGGDQPLALQGLRIPLVVTVAGIRAGMLPRPLESYEHLLDIRSLFPPTPRKLRRKVGDILGVLSELIRQPHRLDTIYLGADEDSQGFDALDAVGFSSSLPGVIHYDVLRRDPEAHARLARLLAQRELGWLADGGLVENCPAHAAHLGLRQRAGGRANPFVLALDGFSPKLLTPAWLPLERLAHENVRRALPWASVYVPFPRTLSPLEIVPGLAQAQRAVALGRAQLAPHMPLLARMLAPLPDLALSRPAAA